MEKKAEHKHCFVCHFCGEDRVMFPCEYQGEHRWVCVTCLPPLIHGMHDIHTVEEEGE